MKQNSLTIKKIGKRIAIFLCSTLFLQQVTAQNGLPGDAIKITGTRLTYGLIQKWIDEYTKLNPGVKIFIVSKIQPDSADILIASHKLRPGDVKPGQAGIALTRYIQLPIVNSRRSDVADLQAKGFRESDFRRIYFSGGLSDNMLPPDYRFAVYKRQRSACASIAFANHFGNEQKDIQGTGVSGDDRDLLDAVKKDSNAISYNNLGFIYNIKTRKVVDSIAIIPIDLNENGKIDEDEKIYGSLDNVLDFAERTRSPKLLTENVNVIFSKHPAKNVSGFLQWILTSGQQYDHEYGFLNLDANTIESEQQLLVSFNSNYSCVPSTGLVIKNAITKK